jgi:hypothetical protein
MKTISWRHSWAPAVGSVNRPSPTPHKNEPDAPISAKHVGAVDVEHR